MAQELLLNDDRLFPPEPAVRAITRRIYAETRELPILSPHGHVPPVWIADDLGFRDPTSLLITPDHYINRMLHANGVDLADLGVGQGPLDEQQARAAFRILCENFQVLNGTAMRYWMVDQLVGIFGVKVRPSAETADQIYDTIAEWIAQDSSKPRALMGQFNITFLATTDDPCDDLGHHAKIAADTEFTAKHRVVPTFRPDRYLEPARDDWNDLVDALGTAAGVEVGTLAGYTAAMENRRAYFAERGAVSTDHAHADLATGYLDAADADRLYAQARRGEATLAQCDQLRRHLLTDQIRMATQDGLTMTLHPAVYRNHDPQAFADFGADVGCDIPILVEVTRALQPALAQFGNHPNLNLVLFTIDEDTYSREIAPLAGWYRSLYIGVPWWFIDAPESILRFKQSITAPITTALRPSC